MSKRQTTEFWQDHLEAWRQSNLTQANDGPQFKFSPAIWLYVGGIYTRALTLSYPFKMH